MDKNRYAVQFEKDKTFLKAYLLGRNYYVALRALGYVERLTAGKLRKDGKMPEFHHMVRLSLTVTQLKTLTSERDRIHGLSLEEQAITALLLHDAMEDF